MPKFDRVIIWLRRLAELVNSPRARLLVRLLFVTTALTFTLIPFIRFLRSGTDMDYRTWYHAGQTVLHGDAIYPQAQNFPFMYPPRARFCWRCRHFLENRR